MKAEKLAILQRVAPKMDFTPNQDLVLTLLEHIKQVEAERDRYKEALESVLSAAKTTHDSDPLQGLLNAGNVAYDALNPDWRKADHAG